MVVSHHEFFTEKAPFDIEFLRIAKASIKYINWGPKLPPFDIRNSSQAFQTMYNHMGFTAIEDVLYQGLTSMYRELYNIDPCNGRHKVTCDMDSCDILVCRDVPTAVKYMHEMADGLEPLNDIVFRDLLSTVERYNQYSNEYDEWNAPKVATFREFSEIVEYVSYVCSDYFHKFLELRSEVRENIIHECLLVEREDDCLSKHQHYNDWGNARCKWAYPDVLIACDNQNTATFLDG
jgi:hypothetical protein